MGIRSPACTLTHLCHRHSDLSAMLWLWPLSPQALLWRGALGMSKHALCRMVASMLCRNGSSHSLSERDVKVLLKADQRHNSRKYCLWNTDLSLHCLDQTVNELWCPGGHITSLNVLVFCLLVSPCPQRQRVHQIPRTGIAGCKLLCKHWELSPGPLQGQLVFLTAEQCLHNHPSF